MKFVTIKGCACMVGRITDHPRSYWIVCEPRTGLAVSDPFETRKEAIADAAKAIERAGGSEGFEAAIQTELYNR